jgi:hypothetical protein
VGVAIPERDHATNSYLFNLIVVTHLNMGFYYSKVIATKTRLYVTQYSFPIFYGFNADSRSLESYEKAVQGTKADMSLYRTRNNLKMLIETNLTPFTKFITLTYANASAGREQITKDFKAFARKLKSYLGGGLRYVYVLEQGKRNTLRWHVHCVLFHDAFIPSRDLKALWNHGHVKINAVDSHTNLGLYLVKYLTKEALDLNKKGYISSQSLIKPVYQRLPESPVIDYSTADYCKKFSRKFKDSKGNSVELSATLLEFDLTSHKK